MKFSYFNIFFLFTTILLINARLCTKQNSIQINLADYKPPRTNTYKFAIDIHSSKAQINKNSNGTFFIGNFSTIVLKNQQHIEFIYDSVQFGFQCPALHKPTKTNQELIELQIVHKIRTNQQSQNRSSLKAPYQWLIFSFPFMVSEYVPDNSLSITNILTAINSNQIIDLRNVVRHLVSAQTLVYTTRQWRFGDKSILRMIRKQIRLMSKQEFSQLKLLIEDQVQLQTNDVNIQVKNKKPQRIYQIKSYPFEQSIAYRKQDL